MNAATATLLCAPLLVTSLAAQRATQEGHPPKVGTRRPIDVSVAGLGAPLDCLERIADQATGTCLMASSTPTLGLLYPYPGLDNTFVPQAFVGGGENNRATGPYSAVGGGRNNLAHGYTYYGVIGYATVGGGGDNQADGAWSTIGGGKLNTARGYRYGYATVAGGEGNSALGDCATVGGGRSNTARGPYGYSTVGGGADNDAHGFAATIAGGRANRASSASFAGGATVGGGVGNSADGAWVTVGGGALNEAYGDASTVGGGVRTTARGYAATTGGGRGNSASGTYATVGGGVYNIVSAARATIGGGNGNEASGDGATVPGGHTNTASGRYAAVGGGESNTAAGVASFAAGRRANANHDGSFVWGDSSFSFPSLKTSSTDDEFNVYASGGVRMFTNSAATTGVLLAAGGSTWTMVSDRDAKENVEPVDARAVLDKVVELPLATWNYKDQDDSIRHMGPMAQDFHAAFGLGLGEKTIDTIDPNGVALAAIQGLNAEIEELRAVNEALLARVERLEAQARVSKARGRAKEPD